MQEPTGFSGVHTVPKASHWCGVISPWSTSLRTNWMTATVLWQPIRCDFSVLELAW